MMKSKSNILMVWRLHRLGPVAQEVANVIVLVAVRRALGETGCFVASAVGLESGVFRTFLDRIAAREAGTRVDDIEIANCRRNFAFASYVVIEHFEAIAERRAGHANAAVVNRVLEDINIPAADLCERLERWNHPS